MNEPQTSKLTRAIHSRHALWIMFLLGTLVGLLLAFPGANTWDDLVQEGHTNWLLYKYGRLAPFTEILPYDQLYGPLWSLLLGFLELPFRSLQDPSLFRHAFTFALYPTSLLLVLRLLLRAGVRLSTAVLSIALITGLIRLGGHALLNVKDFPHAMAFLVVSLYLWVRLKEKLQDEARPFTAKELFVLTFISLVPYLCRTPLLFHFAGLWLFLLAYLLLARHKFSLREGARMLGLPWLYFFLFIAALFPVIWQAGPKPWVHMFVFFSQVYTYGSVRIFAVDYPSNALPRWYSFVWIPLMAQPLALLVAGLGLAGLFGRLKSQNFVIETRWFRFPLGLKTWLAIILAGAWSTVALKSPRLYDEERHVLFLYPMLFLLAGLGLDWLKPRLQYALAALLLLVTLQQHWQWGIYAYIYKSPLFGVQKEADFMGDYWGVCLNDLVPKLPALLPDLKKEIEIPMGMGVARQQYARLQRSIFFRQEKMPELHLVDVATEKSFYYLLIERQAYLRLEPLAGKWKLQSLYQSFTRPHSNAACTLYQAER